MQCRVKTCKTAIQLSRDVDASAENKYLSQVNKKMSNILRINVDVCKRFHQDTAEL